jgi:small subunit ribosomal protein S20
MPTIDSSEKRMRQNEKRRDRNKHHRSKMRTAVSKLEDAIEEGDAEAAREHLPSAESALDRAVSKGVLPKNRASRKVSRLKKRVHELEEQSD